LDTTGLPWLNCLRRLRVNGVTSPQAEATRILEQVFKQPGNVIPVRQYGIPVQNQKGVGIAAVALFAHRRSLAARLSPNDEIHFFPGELHVSPDNLRGLVSRCVIDHRNFANPKILQEE
jgi:hypothetical protein